jgi:hypothetical protein
MLQEHLLEEPHIRRREQMKISMKTMLEYVKIILEGNILHK